MREQSEKLLDLAKKAGIEAADVSFVREDSLTLSSRTGQREFTGHAETVGLFLRVFQGKRVAKISTTKVDEALFPDLMARAAALVRAVPEDPFAVPVLATGPVKADPDIYDPTEKSVKEAALLIKEAEAAALTVKDIVTLEETSASFSKTEIFLAASSGFFGHYRKSGFGISLCAVAAKDGDMQRDYAFSSAVYAEDLKDPAAVGKEAAERARARLQPSRPKTGNFPVVFEKRTASRLLAALAGAVSGGAVAGKRSFLENFYGQRVFPENITVRDNPLKKRGLASAPFDAEGEQGHDLPVIEDGILKNWLLGQRSALQLGLKSNGRASGATNFYMEPGALSEEELIADIPYGLWLTELMGHGADPLTGDYSQGAAGFVIRNGRLAEAVAGFTIAGNLKEMFLTLTPGNNLDLSYSISAPALRTEGMMIAGA